MCWCALPDRAVRWDAAEGAGRGSGASTGAQARARAPGCAEGHMVRERASRTSAWELIEQPHTAMFAAARSSGCIIVQPEGPRVGLHYLGWKTGNRTHVTVSKRK